jgi:hypothetical protein
LNLIVSLSNTSARTVLDRRLQQAHTLQQDYSNTSQTMQKATRTLSLLLLLAASCSLASAYTNTSSGGEVTITTDANRTGVTSATAPDVYLNVPNLSVSKINLTVTNLQAHVNLQVCWAEVVGRHAL